MTNVRTFLDRVNRVGGLDARQARAAARATLVALGERLDDEARAKLRRALPSELGDVLATVRQRGDFDLEELYARVERTEGVGPGFAREHAQIVCRVLEEVLPEEVLVPLEAALPPRIAALLRDVARPDAEPDPYAEGRAGHHTLATGRPGSSHPLSESRPPGAHAHSVAEANPHADTKLSSSAGLTQERLEESLATAHPDERRAISRTSG